MIPSVLVPSLRDSDKLVNSQKKNTMKTTSLLSLASLSATALAAGTFHTEPSPLPSQ